MIIFGTRGVTFGGRAGEFHCPACGARQPYEHKTVRRFFTLYFIPVLPLDKLGEYIECQTCRRTYTPEVLTYDPKIELEKLRGRYYQHIRCLTVLTALVDGEPNCAQVDAIRHVNREVAGVELSPADVEREFALARKEGMDLSAYARQHLGNVTDLGKESVIRAVLAVALADGDLSAREETELADLVRALQMTTAHYRGILTEVEEERQEQGHDQDGHPAFE